MHKLEKPGAPRPDVANCLLADAKRRCHLCGHMLFLVRPGHSLVQEMDLEDLGGLIGRENGSGLARLNGRLQVQLCVGTHIVVLFERVQRDKFVGFFVNFIQFGPYLPLKVTMRLRGQNHNLPGTKIKKSLPVQPKNQKRSKDDDRNGPSVLISMESTTRDGTEGDRQSAP